MSSSFNLYSYTTKEEIENHLGIDLVDMCVQIEKEGYVVQGQYKNLDAYLCESYASEIVEILDERINNARVWYGYATPSNLFVFYDTVKYNHEDAMDKANNL